MGWDGKERVEKEEEERKKEGKIKIGHLFISEWSYALV
jgi:hypothetical protein